MEVYRLLRTLRQFKSTLTGKVFLLYSLISLSTTPTLLKLSLPSLIVSGASLHSYDVFAGPFEDAAAAGQAAGQSALDGFTLPSVDGANIEFQYQDGSSANIDSSQIFVDTGSGDDVNMLESLAGDDAQIQSATKDAAELLDNEDSTLGHAFQTIKGSAQGRAHPDMSADPVWLRSQSVLSGVDPIVESVFTGCSTTYEELPGDDRHVEDLKDCYQLKQLPGSCNVIHDFSAQFIHRIEGDGLIQPCAGGMGFPIPGCLDIWVGRIGNNYWSGNCAIYENNVELFVDAPGIITSASVEQVVYDDYMIIQLNGNEVFRGPGDDVRPALAGEFPPEDCGGRCACELSTSWNYNPGSHGNFIDVTADFQVAGPLNFTIRTSVTGGGEGYARIRAYYDPQAVLPSGGTWEPPECMEVIQAVQDGFCEGSYSCKEGPNAMGCLTLTDGLTICEGHPFWDFIEPSPIPGISKLCRNIEVSANCNWWEHEPECFSTPCTSDPDTGDEICPADSVPQGDGTALVCPSNDGSSTCPALADDPNCVFVSSECAIGALGPSGECYAFKQTYDCGYDVTLPGGVTSDIDCVGPIRCMGNECVDQAQESNPNFAKAAGVGEMINFALMDSNCVGDEESGVVCEVFKGEYYTCKVAVGGVSDCCEEPAGQSAADYIKLALAGWELGQRSGAVDYIASQGLDVKGAWSAIAGSDKATVDTVAEPVVSAYESLAVGAEQATVDTAKSFSLEEIKQQMVKQVAEWTAETFGETAAAALFEQNAAGEFTGQASSAVSTVMYAYMIYSVVLIILQMVYACEAREYEAMGKKAVGACVEIGTWCASDCAVGGCCVETKTGFCCFNGPLARIVMEQVRDYSVMDPKAPDCSGLTLAEMAALDWSSIDLSEWEALLFESGIFPDSNDMANEMWSIENTTYNENADFDAPNVLQRTEQALNPGGVQSDLDETRECVRQKAWGAPEC